MKCHSGIHLLIEILAGRGFAQGKWEIKYLTPVGDGIVYTGPYYKINYTLEEI